MKTLYNSIITFYFIFYIFLFFFYRNYELKKLDKSIEFFDKNFDNSNKIVNENENFIANEN